MCRGAGHCLTREILVDYQSDMASVHQDISQNVSGTFSRAMGRDVAGELVSVSSSALPEFADSLPEASFVWRYVIWERWDEEREAACGKHGVAFFDFDMPLVAALLGVSTISDWPLIDGDENYKKVAPTMRQFIEDLEGAWGSVAGTGNRCITDIALRTYPRTIMLGVSDDAVVVAKIGMAWDGGNGMLSFCYPTPFLSAMLPSYSPGG